MKTKTAYGGWDFTDVWGRRDDMNDGYPYLRWMSPGLDDDDDPEVIVPVQEIIIDKTTIEGKPGDSTQLTCTIKPEDATDKSVAWTSSDEGIATVDNTGLVTLIADGEAVITVTSKAYPEVSATCNVKVETPAVEVRKITIDPRRFSGYVGETQQLTATVSPENATDKTIVWSTSDEEVASVSETGLVTITGVGSATITATASNGVSKTCKVTGTAREVEQVIITPDYINDEIGAQVQLTATVLPEDATDKTITWEVESDSDEPVVTVDENGLVTIVGEGEAVIIARAANGVTGMCRVNGFSGVESVIVDADSTVSIFTLQGQCVFNGKFAEAHLQPGIYIVHKKSGVVKLHIK